MAINLDKYLPSEKSKTETKKGISLDKYLPKEAVKTTASSVAPKPQEEKPREVGLPEHLGGGRYLTTSKSELIKSPRSQEALPAVGTAERDHIMSVALGGTSNKENLQYLATTRDGRQEGKVSVEQKAINDYTSGKISLQEARLRVATKQQQIKGLTPTEEETTTGGQLKKMIKETGSKFANLFKKTKDKVVEKIKDTTPQEVVKTGLEALKTAGETGLNPAAILTKGISKVSEKVALPIVQAPQRALVSVGLEPAKSIMEAAAGKKAEAKFTPTTKLEKIVFGEEPITGIFTRTDEAKGEINQALNKIGINPDIAKGISLALAPLFVAGMTSLDLTPVGGEKKAAEKIALSKNVDEIVDIIRPLFKGKVDEELRIIAEPLTEINKAEEVKKYLQTQGDKFIKGVVKDFEDTKLIQGKKALPEEKRGVSTVDALFGKKAVVEPPVALGEAPASKVNLDKFIEAEKGLAKTDEVIPVVKSSEIVPETAKIAKTIEAPKLPKSPEIKIKTPSQKRLESSVYKRLKEDLPEEIKTSAQYNKLNLKKDAEKAVRLIEEDKNKALRIGLGYEDAPKGQTSTAVNIALSEKARREGNHALQGRLIKTRSLEQTKRGQEIVAEKGSIVNNSADRYIKELISAKLDKLGNKYLDKFNVRRQLGKKTAKTSAVDKIAREVKKIEKTFKEIDISEAQKLIDGLACDY